MEHVAGQASQVGDLLCVPVPHHALDTMNPLRGNHCHAIEKLSSSLELYERVGSPAGMAYSLARKSVLHTLTGDKGLGWQIVQDGFVYAMQAGLGDHCLRRLYAVGIWNRLEAGDLEQAGKLIESTEKLLAKSDACAACILELYPWFSYYFLQTRQIEKACGCYKAVSRLSGKTGNPIGKTIAAMIKSNLYITEMNWKQAEEYSQKSHQMLEEAVPATAQSPIAYFLKRMVEQQGELQQV
ncbi:MAG: hypothetical protein WD426_16045 [Anditalea sp.]